MPVYVTDQNISSEKSEALDSHPMLCYLTDQNISSEKSEALDSHAMLAHAKVI
jgi:hypothetical protein